LQITDANNCSTADTVRVRVSDNAIYVPNAFSPNEDGKNELFRVYVPPGITAYEMRIFSRWGEQIFMSGDINEGWDGKVKGQIKVDVYIYKLMVKYPNGKIKNVSGTVTLL
jgi:gliding motility-associated-like protein